MHWVTLNVLLTLEQISDVRNKGRKTASSGVEAFIEELTCALWGEGAKLEFEWYAHGFISQTGA